MTNLYLQYQKKDSAYALALANRSAVQMRFGKAGFKNAIADVDRALKAGHPAPVKLLERKISCLIELGLISQVKRMNYKVQYIHDLYHGLTNKFFNV